MKKKSKIGKTRSEQHESVARTFSSFFVSVYIKWLMPQNEQTVSSSAASGSRCFGMLLRSPLCVLS